MKDLRTPAAKKRDEKQDALRKAESAKNKMVKTTAIKMVWAKSSPPWQPIETCPFAAFEYEHIMVSDGKDVAIAEIHKRFGRPIRVIERPEMAYTDDGMFLVGGKYEEIDAPDWWFKWEFTDEFGTMTYAGGEETGKEEVSFMPKFWLPLPEPPK